MGRETLQFAFLAFTVIAFVFLSGCSQINTGGDEGNGGDGIVGGGDLTGRWVGKLTEELHGPEGSYPAGCTVEQTIEFNFTQSGSALNGTTTSKLTKMSNCSPVLPPSLIGFTATSRLSGTVSGSSATFSSEDPANFGAANFTVTFSGNTMSGRVETCHSPDIRCTCESPDKRCPGGFDANGMPISGRVQTINWWTGNFTATRAG